MDLKQLRKRGGFVSVAPVRKPVSWKHVDDEGNEQEDTFEVFVKKLSYGMIDSLGNAANPRGGDRAMNAELISKAVRFGEDGTEELGYIEAYQLAPSLAYVLLLAVAEVNRLHKPNKPVEDGESETPQEDDSTPKD